jgi:hypothetical protein
MDITAPELYRRTRDQVIETLENDLRYPDIGWDGREGGPGWAFVRLFGRMSDLAVQRLNQVPDKHFFAFLNAAGIDFVPPNAAETELTFTLADDAPSAVLIPQGSQMATAKTETEAEIVFETVKDITLSKNSLIRAVTCDPRCVSDRTDAAKGVEATSWPAFEGAVERIRSLYLGDKTLFTFDDDTQRAGATLTLTVELETPGQPLIDGWVVTWSCFDGTTWVVLPQDCVTDGTNHFSRNGSVVLTKLPPLVEVSVGDTSSVFICCALEGGSGRKHLPVLRTITGSRSIGISSAPVIPAHVYCAMQSGTAFVPVDPKGEFFPLGQKPSRLDAFYLNADDAFVKNGGAVNLSMSVDHAPDSLAGKPAPTAVIVWEYFGDTGWTALPGVTATNPSFRTAGSATVNFTIPQMTKTAVDGKEGFWIRARLSAGGYDTAGTVTTGADRVVTWVPPTVSAPLFKNFGLTLSYTQTASHPAALAHVAGMVDGSTTDYSKDIQTGKRFSPFKADDEGPACYLGFDGAFPPERWIQIRMDVDEDVLEEEYVTPVSFEYYNGRGFVPLRVSDGTLGFKTKGYLGFFAPEDHGPTKVFGTEAFWIRIKPQQAGADGPYLKTIRPNTVPAVNAETFRDVVLGSSDGKAGQTFKLPRTKAMPGLVLAVLEPDRPGDEELAALGDEIGASATPGPVFPYDSDKWVRWVEVADFYGSGSESRHFISDPVNGMVRFGDGERGAIPQIGQNNIKLVSGRYHDGAKGNIAAGAVAVVRNPSGSLVAVKRVTNVEAASGGSDVESLDDIRQRGPQRLKHRERAVTLEDYEWIAREAGSEVKYARCFPVTDTLGQMKAGHVTVVVTPESSARKPVPGPALIRKVRTWLEDHALTNLMADKNIHVKGPSYVECSVNVTVTPVSPEKSDQVELAILKRLEALLHPLTGGPERKGWTLGRDVYLSEVSAEIEQVDGVDHVSSLSLSGSLQQFHLGFQKEKNHFRRAPYELSSGSRVSTFDERIRCLLADPVQAGSNIEAMTVYAFKAGDTVNVVSETQVEILSNLKISRVTPRPLDTDSGEPMTWEIGFEIPFERPSDWDLRAGLMSADGRMRMTVTAEELTDETGKVTGVVIAGFKKGDRVCVVKGVVREPTMEFIPVAAVRLSNHRVYVPEDCLVFSGTHDVDMNIGD